MSSNVKYQQCTKCILDTNDDDAITFSERGICTFCEAYDQNREKFIKTSVRGQAELAGIIDQIKQHGKKRHYDCILGLSGGVDSTYLALKVRELGLRPLVIHFDNGWNSEIAVGNIENIVNKLNFDLHTIVIDWEEFRDLQLAFLRASVVDIEMVTDHAIFSSLYRMAIQHDIKHIISGVNFATESVLPQSWIHDKRDHINIRAIHKLFGKKPLRKYPLFNSKLKFLISWHGIKSIPLLNYLPYNKVVAKKIIAAEVNWRDYGGKHYESIFTRFYQGYILPRKFGIDKRKAHLSNLINSGQITREEALGEMSLEIYPRELLKKDYNFVLKKLELTNEQFEEIMKLPIRRHQDYPYDQGIYQRFPVLNLFSPFWKLIKRIKL